MLQKHGKGPEPKLIEIASMQEGFFGLQGEP